MNPSRELVEALYREEVLRARQTPAEEKFWDGARLFDYACEISRAGIRHQFPNASEDEVEVELCRRLRIAERRDGEK